MKFLKQIISFVPVLIFSVAIAARTDEVDRYVEMQIKSLRIPGASLAVVRDGRIIKIKGYGLANIEHNIAAAPQTVYEIGSMTKQFTAAAVMMLVEEGKLALDDKITKYFPDAPARWNQITVRHLLTHTSGIQNHVAVPDYMDIFKTSAVGKEYPSREALIQEFYKLPSEFAPGETWSYDNTGYYLLGIIVERASGRSYWQFLDERIFKPLGMSATRSTDARAIVPNRAAGYQWVENRFENRPVLAPFIGYSAGSLLSSVEDLARWDAALYAEKILKKSSLDEMWTPTRAANGAAAAFDYGFGWFIEKYGARRDLHHSGGTIGFSSVIHRFVDDRLTVIILTNHADRMIDQMAFHIAGVYEPKLKRAEGRADPEPDTTLRLKKVMSDLLGAGSAETALLTRELQLHLKSATGKSLWQWYASLGALGAFTFSDREKTNGGGSVVRYKVLLGGNPYWFSFRLKDDGRIAQIYWW